jgi:hypothetical protein
MDMDINHQPPLLFFTNQHFSNTKLSFSLTCIFRKLKTIKKTARAYAIVLRLLCCSLSLG